MLVDFNLMHTKELPFLTWNNSKAEIQCQVTTDLGCHKESKAVKHMPIIMYTLYNQII